MSDLLGVAGKHGCGKSDLASLVVDGLEAVRTDNVNTAMAYAINTILKIK
jgi:ABC-type dipeptide/oligopeptide/nickel transport system ATPase subunit